MNPDGSNRSPMVRGNRPPDRTERILGQLEHVSGKRSLKEQNWGRVLDDTIFRQYSSTEKLDGKYRVCDVNSGQPTLTPSLNDDGLANHFGLNPRPATTVSEHETHNVGSGNPGNTATPTTTEVGQKAAHNVGPSIVTNAQPIPNSNSATNQHGTHNVASGIQGNTTTPATIETGQNAAHNVDPSIPSNVQPNPNSNPAESSDYQIIFVESLTTRGLRSLSEKYGLKHGDLWEAAKGINLPTLMSAKDGKYLELWSIWRADVTSFTREKGLSPGVWRPRPIGIFFRKCQVANQSMWVFVVLIAPISAEKDPLLRSKSKASHFKSLLAFLSSLFGKKQPENEKEFQFCYRDWLNPDGDVDPWCPKEATVDNLINYIKKAIEKGPGSDYFPNKIVLDVFWSWEKYLVAVRNDIRAVMIRSWVWQDNVDVGVCWRFFKYQLIFQDSIVRFQRDREFLLEYQRDLEPKPEENGNPDRRDLEPNPGENGNSDQCDLEPKPRENKNHLDAISSNELIEMLIGALRQTIPQKGPAIAKTWNFPQQLNVNELIGKYNHIIEEMNSLKRSLDAIINMTYTMTSVKEAKISSHSNHNMEYLALLATIFLPVTLVTSGFSMNLGSETKEGMLDWRLYVKVVVPVFVIFSILSIVYFMWRRPDIWRRWVGSHRESAELKSHIV